MRVIRPLWFHERFYAAAAERIEGLLRRLDPPARMRGERA
jgi:hypothetical protein